MIWCVEDDASILDIEVYTLRSTGFQAQGFADGGAFWSALESAPGAAGAGGAGCDAARCGRCGAAAPYAGRPCYPLHPRGHGHGPGGGI